MTDEEFLRRAIAKAREGIAGGQSPFGACLARGGEVIACAHNTVWRDTDITAHAEIVVLREACRILNRVDLSGCVIYSTCEPCPMCFTACHWAKLDRVVFGARTADAHAFGFQELLITDEELRRLGGSPLALTGDVLREECLDLFREWSARPDRRLY